MADLDLKLENIVLSQDFEIKLIDFAFCDPLAQVHYKMKGSESYMAPEVLNTSKNSLKRSRTGISRNSKHSYTGDKADMFSLGVILFTMYFGMVPF